MATLALDLPKAHRLQKNAEPVLAAIDQAIDELKAARHAFSPTLDNRKSIDALAQRLTDLASQLLEISDVDQVECNAELARTAYHAQCTSYVRSANQHLRQILIDEEVELAQTTWKRLVRAMSDVQSALALFARGTDSRAAVMTAAQSAQTQINELLLLDPAMDRWAPKLVTENLDSLLKLLVQPIPTTLPEQSETPALDHSEPNLAAELNALTTVQPSQKQGIGIIGSLRQHFGWAD